MLSLKYETYERKADKPIREYIENMKHFLNQKYPGRFTDEELEKILTDMVGAKLTRPRADVIVHPKPGHGEIKVLDLLSYTNSVLKDKILSPSGSSYVRPDVRKSIFKLKLGDDGKDRSATKKIMLKAKAAGDTVLYEASNLKQSTIKIGMNSLPGAMKSAYNSVFDTANYNSITSIGRYCVMVGYAYTERLVEANIYIPNIDAAINYIVIYTRMMNVAQVSEVITHHDLYVPTTTDLENYLLGCVMNYCIVSPSEEQRLKDFIGTLSPVQRAYVYYIGCLKHLAQHNDHVFRTPMKDVLRDDLPLLSDIQANHLFKLDGVLAACAATINAKHLGGFQLYDTPEKNPDGAVKIVSSARRIEELIDGSYQDIFKMFLRSDNCFSDIFSHPKMVYKTTIISDTDSVIFTLMKWVQWYTGSISFGTDAFAIVAFVILTLTKIFDHSFALMSANVGMVGDDIYQIEMKNEWIMPIMIRTAMAKHYTSINAVQEGTVLPKPELDIKGKNLRGSDLPVITTTTVKEYIEWLHDSIYTGKPLYAAEAIAKVLRFETMAKKSIQNSERTFLPSYPIRKEEDYDKSDPESTKWFYWMMWQEVYSDTYGDIVLPNKVFGMPIMGKGKASRSKKYIDHLMATSPEIGRKYVNFLEKHPDKNITFFIVPVASQIPKEMFPVVDIRKLIYTNMAPFYLLLQSLGIGIQDRQSSVMSLLSDLYEVEDELLE